MTKKLLSFLAMGALLMGTASCSDNDKWSTKDNQVPTVTLASSHIKTEAGYSITIKGELTDADGISSILLWCPNLYLKKTIDIIDIYKEPLESYTLDYTFKIERYKKAESYPIEVTVEDIAGNKSTQTVVVTLDGDYTAPVFVAAPSSETTVLMREGEDTVFDLEFSVTDNIGIDHIIVSVNAYDLSTQEIGASIDAEHWPMEIDVYGEDTYEFSEGVILPSEAASYFVQVEAFDMAAQNEEVRSTVATGIVTVLGGVDFPKMYLSDVATAEELNADVFGVPMRIDRVDECQYRARYYCQNTNTEIYFIPQKGALSPICYGIDPSNSNRLINSPGKVLPIVLPKANQYYEINFNSESGVYDVKEYTPESYMNPVIWPLHSDNLNTWGGWEDTGSDDWIPAADAWMQEFYFGYATSPKEVISFVQDKTNPNLYYLENPMQLNAGEDMHFIIHNWHHDGWWNYCTWRVDNAQECDIFYYYGGVVKQAYLDWWYGNGVADWKKWADDEGYRKNIIYGGAGDQWCEPHVNFSGSYNLYFDAHLGRAKLVPAK